MDYVDIGNFSNFTFDEDIVASRSATDIAQEIIFVIVCLVGVCADATIIFTILRFNRMRTLPNVLLVNWAIADLFSLLVTPSGYIMLHVMDHTPMSPEFLCGLIHFGSVLHLTVVVFVIIVSIDWFMAAYFPRTSEMVRSYHRYVLGAIWTIFLLFGGVTTGLCLADRDSYIAHTLLFCSFWLLLIINVVLQSSRAVCKYHFKRPLGYPSLMLNLASAFLACWSLGLFTSFVINYRPLAIIVECLIFSNAIVNFTILYFSNKDFQACVIQGLKRSENRYVDDVFDFENPVYKSPSANGKAEPNLSFDNQGELLNNAANMDI